VSKLGFKSFLKINFKIISLKINQNGFNDTFLFAEMKKHRIFASSKVTNTLP